jgi:hypothetical protein
LTEYFSTYERLQILSNLKLETSWLVFGWTKWRQEESDT